jgi:pyridoxal phosphate enzyme (YggS family)
MAMIKDSFLEVKEKVAAICKRLGRNPDDVAIIGVSKHAEADKIKEAVDAGLKNIGENKVQEGQRKFPQLEQWGIKVTRHMIGHLQTNKVKHTLQYFDLIHSIDSIKLAQEVQKQAEKINRIVDILIQVNTAGEEQKFGSSKQDALALIEAAAQLKNVRITGLMAMAPLTEDLRIIRRAFSDLRELRDEVRERYRGNNNVEMKYLSMGMTDDYEIALEEGSNMLRIGRAIFKEQ